MDKILFIFAAGGLGALSRYGLQLLSLRWFGVSMWGTLTVNLLGSFLFGLVWSLAHEHRHPWFVGTVGALILVGFLGAFTTFSTLAFEAHGLLERQRWAALVGHLLAHNVLGIACVALGIAAARLRG